MTPAFASDIAIMKAGLREIPTVWEGRETILKMREANFQWKQVEWWAFYFELLFVERLKGEFAIPGEKCGNTAFDGKRSVNWDLKAKAIKSDDHLAILNDQAAIEASIEKWGEHGVVIALCDVEYNDIDRTFQTWRTELQGGKSKYTRDREARTSISRYRKTKAVLTELLFLRLTVDSLSLLGIMSQGRNSNGKPRPKKYMVDLEDLDDLLIDRLILSDADSSRSADGKE